MTLPFITLRRFASRFVFPVAMISSLAAEDSVSAGAGVGVAEAASAFGVAVGLVSPSAVVTT